MLSTTGFIIAITLIGGAVGVDNQVLVGDTAAPPPFPKNIQSRYTVVIITL